MADIRLKVNQHGNQAEFEDYNGSKLYFGVWSTGETVITVNGHSVELTSKASHELRDMLNRRFPNATSVQSEPRRNLRYGPVR